MNQHTIGRILQRVGSSMSRSSGGRRRRGTAAAGRRPAARGRTGGGLGRVVRRFLR